VGTAHRWYRSNHLFGDSDMEALKEVGNWIADAILAVALACVGYFMSLDEDEIP
jgi:hypothetical protein